MFHSGIDKQIFAIVKRSHILSGNTDSTIGRTGSGIDDFNKVFCHIGNYVKRSGVCKNSGNGQSRIFGDFDDFEIGDTADGVCTGNGKFHIAFDNGGTINVFIVVDSISFIELQLFECGSGKTDNRTGDGGTGQIDKNVTLFDIFCRGIIFDIGIIITGDGSDGGVIDRNVDIADDLVGFTPYLS